MHDVIALGEAAGYEAAWVGQHWSDRYAELPLFANMTAARAWHRGWTARKRARAEKLAASAGRPGEWSKYMSRGPGLYAQHTLALVKREFERCMLAYYDGGDAAAEGEG